ncbi:MAG: PilZ domain-containing protein [Planctomycetes bacterium]|nr:PilZ domain-containing protein [Planctomycetota bacterium]
MAIPLNEQPKPVTIETTRARAYEGAREVREQYRVEKQAGSQLEASIECPDGRRVVGQCSDVSVGGAGIVVPQSKDLQLVEGTKVRVRIKHFSRPKEVETEALVVTVSQVGATVRYGLRFPRISEVVKQIDSFYARWFNRRRSQRVMPDFTTKVPVKVRWEGGELQAKVHDISTGGVGILATADQLSGLVEKSRVEVTLTLPGSAATIACRARVAGLRAFTKNMLVGLEFEANGGIERYSVALQRYVDERQRSIAKFNEAAAQQPRRSA